MILLRNIATYLQNQGIGTKSVDIFISRMPDNVNNVVMITQTGGTPDRYLPLQDIAVQISVRDAVFSTGLAKANDIYDLLHGQGDDLVLESDGVDVMEVFANGLPAQLGQDESNRHLFSINFTFKVRTFLEVFTSTEWGHILGDIYEQTDLIDLINTKISGAEWGNITGTLADQEDLTLVLAGKAASDHNHDLVYAEIFHTHSEYALVAHNHDLVYAAIAHNHDLDYAAIDHNHDLVYAAVAHGHNLSDLNNDAEFITVGDIPAETDPVFAASEAASFVAGDKNKLDGIAAGAEVNVQADWDAVSGDAQILNKPALGSAAAEDTTAFAPALSADDNYVTDAEKVVIGNTSGTNSGDEPSASTTVEGIVEIAIASEVNTGTDEARAISPDALAGSNFGIKTVQMIVFDFATDVATGDGKCYFVVPSALNGMNLVGVHGRAITAGITGTMDVQIRNVTDSVDMLSTKLTWDSTEAGTDTATTPVVIDTTHDDVATNDLIAIDVDAVQTTKAKGMIISLSFQLG